MASLLARTTCTAAQRRLGLIAAHQTSRPLALPPQHRQLSSAAAAATSTGPAAGGTVDDAMLAKLGSLSTQAL
eukprot:SAG22_NODE_754_length_7443_cov_4.952478_7_plen_73_part_00